MLGDEKYKECADRARDFMVSAFHDKEHGGLYWAVDYTGKCVSDRKQIYCIAFGIYGLSEHYLATGDEKSLTLAIELFDSIEQYGYDKEHGGYIEACSRDWSGIDDYRLSDKEINCPKSMNTCLHVLEAYTTLCTASKNDRVRKALRDLTRITLDKIINSDWRFDLFFDMEWNVLTNDISYGHDIEGSWLLHEAALAVGDEALIKESEEAAIKIAEAVYDSEALDRKNGGLCRESKDGIMWYKKDWWSQAEAIVGFYNTYELTKDEKYLHEAKEIWDFIQKHFVDFKHGEWYRELNLDNTPDETMGKAGFWKCPYHNSRMCFEMIKRI
jgi:mannobiose 2-epimerase